MKSSLNRVLAMCGGAIFIALLTLPLRAHIVTESPWHPVAASYRTMIFLANLKPVPWNKIEQAFRDTVPGTYSSKSARKKLSELGASDARAGSDAIQSAIAKKDRHALYASATRTVSQSVRHQLALAAEKLDDPGAAIRQIEEAQALYRAFADFIRQSDPAGYRKLGRAWLSLTSSTGSAGILGTGKTASNRQRFAAARQAVDEYFIANFEPASFAKRETLTPVPEHIIAAGTKYKIAPWLPPGSNLNDQNPLPRLVLNFEELGIDESDLPLVAYGDMLFDSPEIFGDPARSLNLACSTCHNRSDINQSLFVPGVSHQAGAADVDGEFFNPRFNDRRNDSLDIPTLRGLRFTGPYGRDGRFASLRDFTRNVIVNEFAGKEPTPFMLDALVAYMLEFDFLPNNKIDGTGRLTSKASAAAHRGAILFRKPFKQMDGKSCASCHVPSGNFLDRQAHDIGSRPNGYDGARDGTFDTPTLLGTQFTAPYFHDGSLPTLASVVDWFNRRYGLALGVRQRQDLTAYLEAIGDGDNPYEIYEGKHTPFRLAFEELTTFASTLETLLPARDAYHAKLMIDTVAPDLSADASAMTNLSAKPKVYELSGILKNIGIAIEQNDWNKAGRLWRDFKNRQEKYDAAMY